MPARFGAAQVRLELARRSGDLEAAAAAATQGERLAAQLPPSLLTRHPQARAWLLAGRAAVDMGAGRFDEAVTALQQAAACGGPFQRAEATGRQALLEAIAGRLTRQASSPWPPRRVTAA